MPVARADGTAYSLTCSLDILYSLCAGSMYAHLTASSNFPSQVAQVFTSYQRGLLLKPRCSLQSATAAQDLKHPPTHTQSLLPQTWNAFLDAVVIHKAFSLPSQKIVLFCNTFVYYFVKFELTCVTHF